MKLKEAFKKSLDFNEYQIGSVLGALTLSIILSIVSVWREITFVTIFTWFGVLILAEILGKTYNYYMRGN